jgi:hypothetical protein
MLHISSENKLQDKIHCLTQNFSKFAQFSIEISGNKKVTAPQGSSTLELLVGQHA